MTTPRTPNPRNPQHMQRCILNLAYRAGGITPRGIQKLIGLGLNDINTSI